MNTFNVWRTERKKSSRKYTSIFTQTKKTKLNFRVIINSASAAEDFFVYLFINETHMKTDRNMSIWYANNLQCENKQDSWSSKHSFNFFRSIEFIGIETTLSIELAEFRWIIFLILELERVWSAPKFLAPWLQSVTMAKASQIFNKELWCNLWRRRQLRSI